MNLSETEYTYNGKVKQPAVIIKDQNGNVISSTNYAVTYASGRKKPGTYSVQITMKGNYTGTQTVLFNIRGKKMPAPKLKAHSRALKVTWKKQKAITGYQIQYKKGYREKVRNLYLSMTAILCNSMEPLFLFFIKTQLSCIFFLTFLLIMSRI